MYETLFVYLFLFLNHFTICSITIWQFAESGQCKKVTGGVYYGLGLIRREKCYPFGRRKCQLPNSRNTKKAISIDEIGSLYYHKPVCINEQKAKDFWMFCYFANDTNVKGVAYVKYKDIEGEYFVFIRAKTALITRHDPKPITVYLSGDMQAFIDQWGNKDQNPNNYMFPILEPGMTVLEQHDCCRSFVKFNNDRMKRMASN